MVWLIQSNLKPYPPGVGFFCSRIVMAEKILSRDRLANICEDARSHDKKIVFTNGCFDILHVGHVRYLKQASSLGDILIVGLNSDSSVNLIKGANRPIIDENARAEIISSLYFVDYVTVFSEPDPLALIRLLRPDILVKGSDWAEDKIIGADFVKSYGGRVVRVKLTPRVSTTGIIEMIVRRYGRTES